jgi:Uma2 family endonuclease
MLPVEVAGSPLRRFTRAEYDRLVKLGLFEDEKIELLYGLLVEMSPHGPPHINAIRKLTKLLILALGDRAEVSPQGPFVASDDSEPEPDLAVIPPGDYNQQHPSRAHLIIEVADSSQHKDRQVKGPLYAASNVPEYWIVLVEKGVVEVYRDPREGQYQHTQTISRRGSITLTAFPDVTLSTADFLP